MERTEEEWAAVRARKAARKQAKAKKMAEVVELKVAGLTFDQIARRLGYKNKSTPSRLFEHAMRAQAKPDADRYRKQYDLRTDRALRGAYEVLVTTKDEKTKLSAADTVARIEAQRAKVLGFEQPTQHRHAGVRNAPPIATQATINFSDIAELTDEELAEARQAAAAAAQTAAGAAAAAAAGPGDGAAAAGGDDGG